MKVIVTGVTGLIGGEVMHQCIADPSITGIFALSRHPLPEALANNSKVTSIIHEDFTSYPEDLLAKLAGAEGCIWTIGIARIGRHQDIGNGALRKIDVGFTQAAITAFEKHLQPQLSAGQKFRFVFTSGMFAEKDQTKSLWFLQEARRSKGDAENVVVEFAKQHPRTFEGFIVRLGIVVPKDSWLTAVLSWLMPTRFITTDQCAVAMIDILQGEERGRTWECEDVVKRGRTALAARHEKSA